MLPPIIIPDDGCAPAEQIFRPLDPAAVPEIAEVIAHLQAHDPEVLAAVADVDRSLIWAAMRRTPWENLAECARMVNSLVSLRERATTRAASGDTDR